MPPYNPARLLRDQGHSDRPRPITPYGAVGQTVAESVPVPIFSMRKTVPRGKTGTALQPCYVHQTATLTAGSAAVRPSPRCI